MKRKWLFLVALAASLFAGCSDYPSTGVVDTRIVREIADIDEITGKAFGLKDTAQGAVLAYEKDLDLLKGVKYRIRQQMIDSGSLDELDFPLEYSGVDNSQMTLMLQRIVDDANVIYRKTQAVLEADIVEAAKALDVARTNLQKLETATAKFEEAVKGEQEAYDAAVEELNAAQQEVGAIYERAATSMSKLAERLGYKGRRSLRYDESLIGEYRSLDYTGRNDLPSDCPAQRGYQTIDTRDLNNQCSYLHIGTIFLETPEIESAAREILRSNFRELAEVMHAIGNDGSGGLKAKVSELQVALSSAHAEAAKTLGSQRERNSEVSKLTHQAAVLEKKLERLKAPEYQQELLYDVDVTYPDGYVETRNAYVKAVQSDLFERHIIELGDVSLHSEVDIKNGYFENVDSGFVGVATVTDVLASRGRSKEVIRAHGYADLTDPEMAEAEQIQVPMDREFIKERRRDDSQQKMWEGLLDYLSDIRQKA
ncbi:hypothetical protein FMN52_01025 [Marinobacter sp. BW6]|uniref:hypothetical protein n=1 Tax=Marinobacter sp. BW6 TaxID=2592624 RepID=UPI0011DEF390|nr:hypothetical protein [Marinobacter sp. BW6]TYC63838.1 hypothetical protein FMN52_01025 [Marinobacter sp. BW6]